MRPLARGKIAPVPGRMFQCLISSARAAEWAAHASGRSAAWISAPNCGASGRLTPEKQVLSVKSVQLNDSHLTIFERIVGYEFAGYGSSFYFEVGRGNGDKDRHARDGYR